MTRTLRALAALTLAALLPHAAGADSHEAEEAETRHEGEISASMPIDLFSVQSSDRGSEIHVLKVPFFELLEVTDRGPDEQSFELIRAPFVSLFRRVRDFGHESLEILDVPFVTFFRRERDEETSSVKLLGLPIIGSLYSSESGPDGTEREILFFIHTRATAGSN